jgi:hypothetical protein
MSTPKSKDLTFYGTVEPTASFAITVPAKARKELGMGDRRPLFIFGSPASRQMIVTTGPESGKDLLDLLSEQSD